MNTIAIAMTEDWVEAFSAPNIEQPVRELYERYYDYVVGQIVQQGGNQEDASDIFQDAVLVFIDKVKKGMFRGESSAKTFLSGIARNIWLSEIRTRDRRRKREHIYQDQFDLIESNTTLSIGPVGESLESTISQIGDTCRKLLTGFYYEKKSMRTLLLEFHYESEQVLRNRKSKCMKKLRELIEQNKPLLEKLKNQ